MILKDKLKLVLSLILTLGTFFIFYFYAKYTENSTHFLYGFEESFTTGVILANIFVYGVITWFSFFELRKQTGLLKIGYGLSFFISFFLFFIFFGGAIIARFFGGV